MTNQNYNSSIICCVSIAWYSLLHFRGELVLGMNNERKMDVVNIEKRCFQALFGQETNENESNSNLK